MKVCQLEKIFSLKFFSVLQRISSSLSLFQVDLLERAIWFYLECRFVDEVFQP